MRRAMQRVGRMDLGGMFKTLLRDAVCRDDQLLNTGKRVESYMKEKLSTPKVGKEQLTFFHVKNHPTLPTRADRANQLHSEVAGINMTP